MPLAVHWRIKLERLNVYNTNKICGNQGTLPLFLKMVQHYFGFFRKDVCRKMLLHVLKQITLTTINVYLHWGSGLTMVAVSWDLELVHTSNESTSDLQVLCHQNVLYLWNRNRDYQDGWIYELYQWNRNTYYQDGWIRKNKDYFPTFWHIWFRPHFLQTNQHSMDAVVKISPATVTSQDFSWYQI